jgi:hypothetical protein
MRLVRSKRFASVIEAVGNTPLLRLERVARSAPSVEVYLKLEFANPGGSVKDRPALRMMKDALADGRLTSDKILIDSTSGNTGVAYSLIGAALGIRVQLVMPKNVTKARKDITQAFGTELIYSDPMEGSDGAIRLVRKIVAENPDRYFYPDQYSNPSNPLAHYHGTGAEILDALGDDDGYDPPTARAPSKDPVPGARAGRSAARARRPETHGVEHHPGDLRRWAPGRACDRLDGRRLGHVRPPRFGRGALRGALHGSQCFCRGQSRGRAPREKRAGLYRDDRLRSRRSVFRTDEMGEEVRMVIRDDSCGGRGEP